MTVSLASAPTTRSRKATLAGQCGGCGFSALGAPPLGRRKADRARIAPPSSRITSPTFCDEAATFSPTRFHISFSMKRSITRLMAFSARLLSGVPSGIWNFARYSASARACVGSVSSSKILTRSASRNTSGAFPFAISTATLMLLSTDTEVYGLPRCARAIPRDGACGRRSGAGIPRAADAAQRDGVVPVGQTGSHRTVKVDGSVGVLLSTEVVNLERSAGCLELGRDDRQDHDVDGLSLCSHRSHTRHAFH